MNAHADMLIVVGHNGYNIPRGIYRSLVSGEKKVSSFLFTKTSANKRLFIICLQSPIWVCGCKGSEIFWIEQENSLLLAIFCAEGKV